MFNFLKPSSLATRIIVINSLGLILLAFGFIYVDKSEDNLIEARKEALLVQANLFAFSFYLDPEISISFRENINKFVLKRQENVIVKTRTRIFDNQKENYYDTQDFEEPNKSLNNNEENKISLFDKILDVMGFI